MLAGTVLKSEEHLACWLLCIRLLVRTQVVTLAAQSSAAGKELATVIVITVRRCHASHASHAHVCVCLVPHTPSPSPA